MHSVLEVSKEGITIHQIPLSDRVSVGSEEWKKIPDRSISHLERNIQFRLIDGKSLMVYLLDNKSKITLKGVEHLGPKTILIPHNEKVLVETGHSLKLTTDLTEDRKVFAKATIFKNNLPGLKIDGIPVVFNALDDAVDVVEVSADEQEEEFFKDDIDEIELEKALDDKVELNKLYYDDDETEFENESIPKDAPTEPPPVEEIKTNEEREQEAVHEIMEVSNHDIEELDPETVEIKDALSISESDEEDIEEEYEEEYEEEWDDLKSVEEIESAEAADAIQMVEAVENEEDISEGQEIDEDAEEEIEDFKNEDENENDNEVFDISLDDDDDDVEIENDHEVYEVQKETEKVDSPLPENIVIGADFEEKVKEDLQMLEDQSLLDELEINEDEVKDSEIEEAPVSSTEPEVPDDEEWERIQAEMENRLNTKKEPLHEDDRTDPNSNNHSLQFDAINEDEEIMEEEDEDFSSEEDQESAINKFGTRIKNLFKRSPQNKENSTDTNIPFESELVSISDEIENKTMVQKVKSIFARKKKIKEGLAMGDPNDTDPSGPKIVFDQNQTGTKSKATETIFEKDVPFQDESTSHGLYPEEEEINYEELDFERPEISEIRSLEEEDLGKSNSFSKKILNRAKNLFRRGPITDHSYDEFTGTDTVNEFNEFKAPNQTQDSQINIKGPSLIEKIKGFFKRNNVEDSDYDDENTDEMTNAQIEAEKIAKALERNQDPNQDEDEEEYEDDEYEDDDEDIEDESGNKKKKKSGFFSKRKKKKKITNKALLKAAKKSKSKHGQDPRPGVFARTLSICIGVFIIFNLFHYFGDHPKVEEIFTQHIDDRVDSIKNPIKNVLRTLSSKIPANTPPEAKKYLAKYYNPNHIDVLFQTEYMRFLIFYLLYELIFLILLGNSLPLHLFGARNEKIGLKARGQALLRFILWPLTILFPILDLPVLIGRRSFREVVTGTYILYPNTSYRNYIMFLGLPILLISFFVWPYFLNLDVFSSREIRYSDYQPANQNDLQYSEILDLSINPDLKTGYVYIPAWEVGNDQQMQASLKIYSVKTDQEAYLKKYHPIDLVKILNKVTKFDPLFFHFHPELRAFQKGSESVPNRENLQALNDYLLACLSLSIFDYKGILNLYKSGPYINDDFQFKKLFLKHIDQIGINEIIIHKNESEKTIEVVPSRQSSIQTSFFIALGEDQNYLYSLTYSKKATDTRNLMTQLSLSQMSFTYKSPTPVKDIAIKTLDNLKMLVDPNNKDEKVYEELFTYYYQLGKHAIESNQKRYIDLAKIEVVKTGDLVGKIKHDPKLSQKYRERFRNLSKALETLDVRYFSM